MFLFVQKHGFVDPDRKSSKHDKIQLWAYNNINDVLKSLSAHDNLFDITCRELERPIVQTSPNYKTIVGFVDLYVSGYTTKNPSDEAKKETVRFDVSVEVKSENSSCGDLIRQINFYRKFEMGRSVWIVVSSDDRFVDVLREQWIYSTSSNQTAKFALPPKNDFY